MDDIHYKLIEFTKETCKKKKCVDFVPSIWISYNIEHEGLVSKFMPPPYDDESSALLHSLIKCAAPAPGAWPDYPIAIRGEARTYEEAVKKLRVLDNKKYAYSTDEECTAEDRAMTASKAYKEKEFELDDDANLWDVPELVYQDKNSLSTEVSSSKPPRKSKQETAQKGTGAKSKIVLKPPSNSDKIRERATEKSIHQTLPSADSQHNKNVREPIVLFEDFLHVVEPQQDTSSEDIKAAIVKGFHAQSLQLTKLSIQLEEIKIMMSEANLGYVSGKPYFGYPTDKYDIELPLKVVEDFEAFDRKLLEDTQFCDDTMASMWQIASVSAPMVQTMRDIFKKFISRDLALQCTAVKNTGKKVVLNRTKFFYCCQDVVIAKYKQNEKIGVVTPKEFDQAVGKVINNAKDWEGNRSTRTQRSNK